MPGTSAQRWLTVMMDGSWIRAEHRRRGCQLVIGEGYEIGDFLNDVSSKKIQLKGDAVALMVGNEQLQIGKQVNISKQIEKLIRQIWVVKPVVDVYVSSVLPRPTQETMTQALVMKVNVGIATMFRRLDKYGQGPVRYVPLHQHLLEKWKHSDEKSGKMRKSTRIIQPHGLYYELGTDILNAEGVRRILDKLEEFVIRDRRGKEDTSVAGSSLMQQPGLVIQIRNDRQADETEQLKGLVQSAKPGKGKKACKASHRQTTHDKTKIPLNRAAAQVGQERTRMQKTGDAEKNRKVSKLVDKWEQLSQGLAAGDIDLELGQDSVVQVDLGGPA